MPLLDHFHPPLSLHRSWHAFHNSWATYLSADLNRRLPAGYFAAANVQFEIEIDVAVLDETESGSPAGWSGAGPSLSIPLALLTDSVEVQIFSTDAGPTLAGAIELVSPRNKDRDASRAAFVSRCASFVQSGVGLVIVDVVTNRLADLHVELLQHLDHPEETPTPGGLYAVAYHPLRRDGEPRLDIWRSPLTLGETLPTLPLWIRGGPCLGVDLEATYERTRQEQRVNLEGVAS